MMLKVNLDNIFASRLLTLDLRKVISIFVLEFDGKKQEFISSEL